MNLPKKNTSKQANLRKEKFIQSSREVRVDGLEEDLGSTLKVLKATTGYEFSLQQSFLQEKISFYKFNVRN